MIQVLFKNLEPSEMAREAAVERVATLVEKFPELQASKVQVILEMENSPHQPGPDLFTVKVHVSQGAYRGLTVRKSAQSLYVALADVVEHMLEALNRFGDKARVRQRALARRLAVEPEWSGETSPL